MSRRGPGGYSLVDESRLRPKVYSAPPPKASHPRWTPPNIIALVAALLGSGGIGAFGAVKVQDTYRWDRIEALYNDQKQDIKQQNELLRQIRDYLRAAHERNEQRWDIVVPVMCKFNGSRPFARNVDCDAVEFEPLPLAKNFGPGWKSTQSWPWPATPP